MCGSTNVAMSLRSVSVESNLRITASVCSISQYATLSSVAGAIRREKWREESSELKNVPPLTTLVPTSNS